MSSGGAGLERIGQIAVTVKDVESARAFYGDVLELEHLFDAPGLSFFRCGSVRLMLTEPESDEIDRPSSILYFQVADVEASHATLLARGVEFRQGPAVIHRTDEYDLWMAFFLDGVGNTLALMAERPTVSEADS